MSVKCNNIKLFVASTVYNFQSDLNRIYNLFGDCNDTKAKTIEDVVEQSIRVDS